MPSNRTYKMVLLGDFGVGKTSLGVRITEDRFEELTKATIGVAHFTAQIMDSFYRRATLEIWDTAGQERYRSLDNMRMYLRNASAALVIFDVTSKRTFDSAKRLVAQLQSDDVNASKQLIIALVANKNDLQEHQIDLHTLQSYAHAHDVPVFGLASCKTGFNVANIVRQVADRLTALPDHEADSSARGTKIIMPTSQNASGSCC